mmetsp:Transcript_19107/g.28818  ORF Transcript_19107/g.28818 Transcript_19107/m.28818 type:complete len:213 (+) Transcript_19107:477-1115(+)
MAEHRAALRAGHAGRIHRNHTQGHHRQCHRRGFGSGSRLPRGHGRAAPGAGERLLHLLQGRLRAVLLRGRPRRACVLCGRAAHPAGPHRPHARRPAPLLGQSKRHGPHSQRAQGALAPCGRDLPEGGHARAPPLSHPGKPHRGGADSGVPRHGGRLRAELERAQPGRDPARLPAEPRRARHPATPPAEGRGRRAEHDALEPPPPRAPAPPQL